MDGDENVIIKGEFKMNFTEDDSKMKEVNNKVKISLLCDKSDLLNEEVIKFVDKNEKQKAIGLLESYVSECEKFEKLDETGFISSVINQTKKSLIELNKKEDYNKEIIMKTSDEARHRGRRKSINCYADAFDSDEEN